MKNTVNYITKWLTKYLSNPNCNGFAVGVSGGIDSAVTSKLCAMTGKPTFLLNMPIHQAPDQYSRAMYHIAKLYEEFDNVETETIDLTPVYDEFAKVNFAINDFALANARARLRMTTLYYHAQANQYVVVGTGNKVEDFGVGFFTKYGDGGVDISPIADLLKSEVYAVGREIGISEDIMNAAPTDGLHDDGRTDEDQLGVSYDMLEFAMTENVNRLDLTREQLDAIRVYTKFHKANKHKMEPIPVCTIPKKIRAEDGYL